MSERRNWYLVFYDIRDAQRWRQVHRIVRGYGRRVQYSVFRVRATITQAKQLRWELEKVMAEEDDLLMVELCATCTARIENRHPEKAWPDEDHGFKIVG